jgi:hypothetical protein
MDPVNKKNVDEPLRRILSLSKWLLFIPPPWLVLRVLPHFWWFSRVSSCQEDAFSQQLEAGPAIHLPFQVLQPVDLPFHLSVAPLQT